MRPARVVADVRFAHPVHPQDGVVPHPVHLGVQGPGHVLAVLDPVDEDGLVPSMTEQSMEARWCSVRERSV